MRTEADIISGLLGSYPVDCECASCLSGRGPDYHDPREWKNLSDHHAKVGMDKRDKKRKESR